MTKPVFFENEKTMKEVMDELMSIISFATSDYTLFSNTYSDKIKSHGEREFDGAIFEINLTDDLILYLVSESYKVVRFEVISISNSVSNDTELLMLKI
ncbi:MAG: hypothetical protein WCJ03_03895 [Bacteroidales bacterium]